MRKLNRHPNSLSYTKQFKWYSLERWQVLMRLPGGEHSFSAFADSVSFHAHRCVMPVAIPSLKIQREEKEMKENTYPTTLRTCLETAPSSIPSLLLNKYKYTSLDPFLGLSGCLPFAPCPNIWPFCWQIKLHSFFCHKHWKRTVWCYFLPIFVSLLYLCPWQLSAVICS